MATWLFVQHIMQANTNEMSFCDGIQPVSEGLNCGNCPHVVTSSYNVYIINGPLMVGTKVTSGYWRQLWQVNAHEKQDVLQTVNLM